MFGLLLTTFHPGRLTSVHLWDTLTQWRICSGHQMNPMSYLHVLLTRGILSFSLLNILEYTWFCFRLAWFCCFSIRIWDTRVAPNKANQLTVAGAHLSDVNVISWNKKEPFLVSGGDDGFLHIWDLRQFKVPKLFSYFLYSVMIGNIYFVLPVTGWCFSCNIQASHWASDDCWMAPHWTKCVCIRGIW